jgi:hypothetical protein
LFVCFFICFVDLEWKLIYVDSAGDKTMDQVCDIVSIGNVVIGCNRFVFESEAPDFNKIPSIEVMEVSQK